MNIGKLMKSFEEGNNQGNNITATIIRRLASAAALGCALALMPACGSSEADKTAPELDTQGVESRPGLTARGQFVDSPVSGLFYRTESQEGFTDHNGYFEFREGESVSFYIGNIFLGSTEVDDIITPEDLAKKSSGELSDTAVNILRLLQTLDEDGDPSNGISINDATQFAASQIHQNSISVTVSCAEFENNTTLMELIGQTTNIATLVDENQAVQHYQSTLVMLQAR